MSASIRVDGQANVTEHTISTSFIHQGVRYLFNGSFDRQIPAVGLAAAVLTTPNIEEIKNAKSFLGKFDNSNIVFLFEGAGGTEINVFFKGGPGAPIDFSGSGTWNIQ